MIDVNGITDALGIPCMISDKMCDAMDEWENAYTDKSSWLTKRVRSMRLPATIARELKRLTLTEISVSTTDDQLNKFMSAVIGLLRRELDHGLATGGMLLKPYYVQNSISVDISPQNHYLPVNFTDNSCDAVICPEVLVLGKNFYTRLEYHYYDREKRTHTIENHCYRSGVPDTLGTVCGLSEVSAWSDILPKKVFENVDKPLFAIFRMPDSNHIDPLSPLGVSAYADAMDFIRDADEQWERILWELISSERAIDASEDLFRFNPYTQKPVLPEGRERMFRLHEITGGDKPFFNTFSPEIRDASQFNALNQILRRIENAVGLSYGTLSEVSEVEKTAEEIRSSKQRSFARICDIQQSLQESLSNLLYAMQYYRDYYTGKANPAAELNCTFGDGVLEDIEKEFQRRLLLVQAGYYDPALLLSWYFGCSVEEARTMIPDNSMKSNAAKLFDGDS
ncbi:MAG: hypothetical protein K2H01_04700 [Ruminococcus sp.]|nr:hypothetical protein [Ruminococcus sp.]